MHLLMSVKLELMAFVSGNLRVLLLHRKPKCSYEDLWDTLQFVLGMQVDNVDLHRLLTVIIGDFNIDYESHFHRSVARKLQAMGFSQRVKSPTRGRNLLDHVWVSNKEMVKEVTILETYHSDHHPIFVHLTMP
jgi:endonuclease/exonuclease/phosphatase family metal-dependent hydrolase